MGNLLEDLLQAATSEFEFLATKDQLNITDHDRHRCLIASLRSALTKLAKQDCANDDGGKFESTPAEKCK